MTGFEMWLPICILSASGHWSDASLPAEAKWPSTVLSQLPHATRTEISRIRSSSMDQESRVLHLDTSGQEILGPEGFKALGAQICEWSGMLLNGEAFDRDVERFRMEVAVQTCESQARLLEDIASGKALELQSQGGSKRFNIVFLLQALWFSFNLKSASVLRRSLLSACKLMFGNTQHSFLEDAISMETLPLPSQSVLSQARFFLDLALMCEMRQRHAQMFDPRKGSTHVIDDHGAMYLMADSSPQGGVNWLMIEYSVIQHRDLIVCSMAASELSGAARRLTDAQEAGVPLLQEELDAERSAAEAIFGMLQRHPMVPVGLGSGRSSMWHELHALYHSFFLECGDPALLSELAASIISLTSDRGTEAGFAGAHPVPFNMFFPHYDQAQLEFQEDGGMGIVAEEAAPAAAVPVPPPPPPAPSLSMQSALPTPGCLHIVHNATRSMLRAMPHFEDKVKASFAAVVDVLHSSYTRQRFVATCLNTPEAS